MYFYKVIFDPVRIEVIAFLCFPWMRTHAQIAIKAYFYLRLDKVNCAGLSGQSLS